jgi:hypothetical protein
MSARPDLSIGAVSPDLSSPVSDGNNIPAKRSQEDSIVLQFGGCDGRLANCLPTVPDWTYLVRRGRSRLAASTK